MKERYILYPEHNEGAFKEICNAFETDFSHFEKHKLFYGVLSREYLQVYSYNNPKSTFQCVRIYCDHDITIEANFDISRFVAKVKSTILHKVKIDSDIYNYPARYIHGCYFVVNQTNDIKLISKIANSLIKYGCTVFSFYGKYADLWHNVFDDIFIRKHYTEDDDKVALTVTAENLETLADDITLNVPRLKSFEHHCRVIYYDDESELATLQHYLKQSSLERE